MIPDHLSWSSPWISKNQDTHVFYVLRQKSPCFLQLCCALTTAPFVASNGSNWPFGSWESAASLNLKIGWVLWDLWHFENGVFWAKIKNSWNLHISNLTFWPISISNLCHSQTIRDRCMKPSSNNPLTSQFLQGKSSRLIYLPTQEKYLWSLLAVRILKFAAHDYPGF